MKNKYSVIILNALPDKKIKSLGNKGLITLDNAYYLIDYQIRFARVLFNNPEIIVVAGFDSKRLKKYIDNHKDYQSIKYIDHIIDNTTNIGTSLRYGMGLVTHNNCFIINSSFVFSTKIKSVVSKHFNDSGVLVTKTNGHIGYTIDNEYLLNCYYDLPHNLLDGMFIHNKDLEIFKNICLNKIDNLYLFEIINRSIESKIRFKPINITNKDVYTVDSIQNIEKMRNKLCII
jgi:hypothetical protein